MLRTLPFTLLFAAPVHGQSPPSVGEPPAECGDLPVGDVQLGSQDFGLDISPGDSTARLRLPDHLPATATRPALDIVGGLAEVSLQPDQILPVRAAHQAGILHAVVGLVEAPGPRAAPGCADLVVNSIHLRIGEVLIGTAHLAQAGADRQTSPTAVRVGELSMEPGSPPVAEAYIREQLRFRGELCARRASERDGAMRGSVIVELEAREPGRMVRPSAPLDSLQQPPLLFCLLNALYDDPELARSLPGGAHFYAPFYFTPDDSARLLIHSQAP